MFPEKTTQLFVCKADILSSFFFKVITTSNPKQNRPETPKSLQATLFHTECLIGLAGPHLRHFLILNMLPPERSVLKELVLIALLQNESLDKYLMLRVAGQSPNSGRRYLLPLDGAAYLKY